jgi:hypothetical protein
MNHPPLENYSCHLNCETVGHGKLFTVFLELDAQTKTLGSKPSFSISNSIGFEESSKGIRKFRNIWGRQPERSISADGPLAMDDSLIRLAGTLISFAAGQLGSAQELPVAGIL